MVSEEYPQYVQDLLDKVDQRDDFFKLLNSYNPFNLVIVQDCLWNYVMGFGREKGIELKRDDITSRMESTAHYMYRVGCDEPIEYCRANICVNTNPNCAADKLRDSIRVLYEVLIELKKK